MSIKVLSVKNIVTPKGVKILTVGTQGAAGISASITPLTMVAGEVLGSLRAVININSQVFYANNENPLHSNKVIGIVTQAVNINESVTVQTSGELEGFFGLTIGEPVYLQSNGTITSVLPVIGFVQQLGIAITTTKILINIQPTITLIG